MRHRSLFFGLFVGFVVFVVGAFFFARIYSHPIALAQKIAEADSATVTNHFQGDEAFGIVLTGDDAKKIVLAIGAANRGPLFVKSACTPFLRLEFYKATNLLATVDSCGKLFWVGDAEYLDQTGVLEALEGEYLQRRREREHEELSPPTNNAAFFTNSP